MDKYGKKLYISAFVISVVSALLLIAGMIFYGVTGRNGLIQLIILSVSACVFALVGIALLCVDIKAKSQESVEDIGK